jgi:hypothetical protein
MKDKVQQKNSSSERKKRRELGGSLSPHGTLPQNLN